jgi:hypothetical protein
MPCVCGPAPHACQPDLAQLHTSLLCWYQHHTSPSLARPQELSACQALPTLLVQYTGAYAPCAHVLPSWKVAQVSNWARLLQRSMEDQVSGDCLNRLPRPAQRSKHGQRCREQAGKLLRYAWQWLAQLPARSWAC